MSSTEKKRTTTSIKKKLHKFSEKDEMEFLQTIYETQTLQRLPTPGGGKFKMTDDEIDFWENVKEHVHYNVLRRFLKKIGYEKSVRTKNDAINVLKRMVQEKNLELTKLREEMYKPKTSKTDINSAITMLKGILG